MRINDISAKKALRRVFLFCFCFLLMGSAMSAEVISQLKDEARSIGEAYALHITSDSAPFSNATLSLNHEDAWLYFDNIKPSDVINNYLGNIKVNGAAFGERTNGRVARYAHGTVVMPHASSFTPLTVYTEDDFNGDSAQYKQHTYFTNLGNMDNAIKSFKLKRGYIATFANASDGTGYSRVFIADEQDIEFSVMPEALHGRASFIRVLRYEWVTKKGWCGGAYEGDLSGSTWYYNWQANLQSTSDLEFVPMRAKLNWSPWSQINALQNVSHSLGLNEPDHSEQHKDDNGEKVVTVAQALEQWPEMLKSGLRIGAPATTNFNWLYDFVDQCKELNYRVDYVAVHAYWGSSAQSYYNNLKYVHERTGLPIWITEWNYGANWTSEWWPNDPSGYTDDNANYAYNHIKEIVEMFDTAHFIERYSIYNWVEDARAIVLNGALTKAGEYYANNNSVIAYNKKNEVILDWNYEVPTISYRFLSLSNSINVSWQDPNGEMSRVHEVQKRVANGAYETIYTSDDVSRNSYSDVLNPELNGRITYRFRLKTIGGDFLTSNEVSYYQSEGVDTVQVANLSVSGDEWQSCLFSRKFEATPSIILGIPTFNNITPLTTRVNNVSTKSFKLTLNPWAYISSPILSKYDNLSLLALPGGVYDFGGLSGEVATVGGIGDDWVPLSFSQVYDTIPVVFATQISNLNTSPTSVAIRNVTKTGFEISIRVEEALSSRSVYDEKISYLVIEPGQGSLEGKRISVGHTLEGEGVTSNVLNVTYPNDYTQPTIFANLQSAEDAFASTVRYVSDGPGAIRLFKQRELSGDLASVKLDKLAWLVMDISKDQEVSLLVSPKRSKVDIYPNPVVDVFHFNTSEPQMIRIYTLSGQEVLTTLSSGSVDMSGLSSGIYLCTIGGALTKIIKQ